MLLIYVLFYFNQNDLLIDIMRYIACRSATYIYRYVVVILDVPLHEKWRKSVA